MNKQKVDNNGRDLRLILSICELLSRDDLDGQRVLISGRVQKKWASKIEIGEDIYSLTVNLDSQRSDLKTHDWVRLEGKWINSIKTLVEPHILFVRSSHLLEGFKWSKDLPELKYIKSSKLLGNFHLRNAFLKWTREFMAQNGFLEVKTPTLHSAPESCFVEQFSLSNQNGTSYYLRTDPEEYLKRYLTAGLPAVFEISTNFRMETPSQISLQEFTSLECYRKFETFEGIIDFLNLFLEQSIKHFNLENGGKILGKKYQLEFPIPKRKCKDLIFDHSKIDIDQFSTAQTLSEKIKNSGLWGGTGTELDKYRRTWIEWLIETQVLPNIDFPVMMIDFPSELGLNASEKVENPAYSNRGELYFPGGFELANFYHNITQYDRLKNRYSQRLQHRIVGGLEPVSLDEGLLGSAAIGMPNMAGLAIGIERFMMVIFDDWLVEDGLLFPKE